MKKTKKKTMATEVVIQRPFWTNRYFWISSVFSVFWVIFIIRYLTLSGWWQGRFDLLPAELVGGLGGLIMPMVLVWLLCAYFDRTDQLQAEADVLKSYLNELVYPTEEGAIYTKSLTEALKIQIKEFRAVFQEVNDQTQSVRDDLKHWVQDLSSIIKHVDTKTIQSVKTIAAHIQKLAQVTDVANKQSEKTAGLFSEQAAILERIVDGTIKSTTGLTENLGASATEMKALMQEADQVGLKIAQSMAQTQEVVESMAKTSDKIEQSVNLYETSARQQNARLFGNLEKVLSVFRANGDLLEQEVGRTTNRLTVAENALKQQAENVIMLTDKAAQKTDEVSMSLSETKDELTTALRVFKLDAANVAQQIERASEKIFAAPVVQKVKTDNLLQKATGILNRLQEFSVDMAHLFSPKSEEMLWERYYNGDKTVFMRHIKSELGSGKEKKLRELYLSDPQFKEAVDHYMLSFEHMTQNINKGDDSKLLMSIVIGSDIGRLYMVLANMVKGSDE